MVLEIINIPNQYALVNHELVFAMGEGGIRNYLCSCTDRYVIMHARSHADRCLHAEIRNCIYARTIILYLIGTE